MLSSAANLFFMLAAKSTVFFVIQGGRWRILRKKDKRGFKMQVWDVVILGGGAAGCTAALYCARAGLSAAVLEQTGAVGQMAITNWVDNYPGFPEGISGFQLAEQMRRGAERYGARFFQTDMQTAALGGECKRIGTDIGEFQGKTVILATGADPRPLGLPEERRLFGRGVSYCATCDGPLYRGKTVAVVGGGNSAAEEAAFLAGFCEKVYLIHRRDALRAEKGVQEKLFAAKNVEILWNTQVAALLGGDRLTGLSLQRRGKTELFALECDGLFVAIGRTPNTGLFAGEVALDAGGYVLADETTNANCPGVFAAGDVRRKPLRQIATAVADGAVAASQAAAYLQGSGQRPPAARYERLYGFDKPLGEN